MSCSYCTRDALPDPQVGWGGIPRSTNPIPPHRCPITSPMSLPWPIFAEGFATYFSRCSTGSDKASVKLYVF